MSTVVRPIQGKVARILNKRVVVLNRGASHGVELGMEFNILSPTDHEIKDPDTGEILGSIKRTKIKVKVTSVHERMSFASTFVKHRINVGGPGISGAMALGLESVFEPPKWKTEYETLRTDEDVLEVLDEEERRVQTGDTVVQATEVDDSGEFSEYQCD